MSESVLEIRDVSISYGDNKIIKKLNLCVSEGEFIGIIGPNGCGKTTLLNAVSGSMRVDCGTILIQQRELDKLSPKERARIVSFVSQNPVLPMGFIVEEIVLMGRNPHLGLLDWESGKDFEIVHNALQLSGVTNFKDRLITTLSGGEMQRVFIARALAQESSIMLLDEPTAHLDIGFQTGVLDLVENVRKHSSLTIVAAMHDLTLAAQYCDRIVLIEGGSITVCGTPSEVITGDNIARVFGANVEIMTHPIHNTPVVLPVSSRSASHE